METKLDLKVNDAARLARVEEALEVEEAHWKRMAFGLRSARKHALLLMFHSFFFI